MRGRSVRFGLLSVLVFVATALQLPVVDTATAHPGGAVATPRWTVPMRPSLVKCRSDFGRSCRPILDAYGDRVARLASERRGHRSRLGPSASVAASTGTCPKQAFDGAICGHVDVPLDRSSPVAGTLAIAFELYTHTDPGPAESAILVNFGGPGGGTTTSRGGAFYLFGANLDRHDLLLIDDRGRGYSGAIDCPMMQGAAGTIAEQTDECSALLGSSSSRYGTGDVAMDTDAVRAALGYELVDYYGVSYGGADITGYATRFPEHIRSLVLDAPWGDTAIAKELFDEKVFVSSTEKMIALLCRRSPSCASVRTDPIEDFGRLVRQVRRHPVVGVGYAADGNPVRVKITPWFVVNYLMLSGFTDAGELAAASAALRHGDRVPLLRIAAESYYPIRNLDEPEPFPPKFYSLGDFVAAFCVDNQWEWDWSASIPDRETQHAAALAAQPAGYFGPFTGLEASNSTFVGTPYCIRWPAPQNVPPMAAPGASYPDVPTLVMGGDLDNVVPFVQARLMADLFPNSRLIKVKGAGHGAAFFNTCAAELASTLVQTLEVPTSDCGQRPEVIWPSVGRFPVHAAGAPPAVPDPSGTNDVGPRERRVAAAAVMVVKDALERANLAFFGPGTITGRGLRGGRVVYRFAGSRGSDWTIHLHHVRFTNDVVVDGVIHWRQGAKVDADIRVSGSAGVRGVLSIFTDSYMTGRMFQVRGDLSGESVALLAPAV
jgi:pimeloyl-ACP methyl ester carboxylesterase